MERIWRPISYTVTRCTRVCVYVRSSEIATEKQEFFTNTPVLFQRTHTILWKSCLERACVYLYVANFIRLWQTALIVYETIGTDFAFSGCCGSQFMRYNQCHVHAIRTSLVFVPHAANKLKIEWFLNATKTKQNERFDFKCRKKIQFSLYFSPCISLTYW